MRHREESALELSSSPLRCTEVSYLQGSILLSPSVFPELIQTPLGGSHWVEIQHTLVRSTRTPCHPAAGPILALHIPSSTSFTSTSAAKLYLQIQSPYYERPLSNQRHHRSSSRSSAVRLSTTPHHRYRRPQKLSLVSSSSRFVRIGFSDRRPLVSLFLHSSDYGVPPSALHRQIGSGQRVRTVAKTPVLH